ncbi:MAG: hypothetical protein WBI63_03930 [Coriobacteriia bacterium]
MASLIGIKVDRNTMVDDARLAYADGQAQVAASRFTLGLIAAVACVAAVAVLVPMEAARMGPLLDIGFEWIAIQALVAGLPWSVAEVLAAGTMVLMGIAIGVMNATILGGVPIHLLRRGARAAAPAVSIALAWQAGTLEDGQLSGYPRVTCAVSRILGPRRR